MIEEFYEALKEIEQDCDKYMLLFKGKERVAVIRGGEELDVAFDLFTGYNGEYCLDLGCGERMEVYFDDYEVHCI